jgi:hypothetical protein
MRHSDLKQEIQMRLASFKADNKSTYGLVSGDDLHEASESFRARYPL